MTWLTRVTPHPQAPDALRVEISSGGSARDGWVTPRELAARYPETDEGPLCGLTSVRKPSEKLTDVAVGLVPGVDLVLEQEVEVGNPFVVPEQPKACSTPGCKGTFAPMRNRQKCDTCRYPNDKEPLPKVAVAKPRELPPPIVMPKAVSPVVALRNTASPYDAVIADLVAKRDQIDAAIEALRAISGAA